MREKIKENIKYLLGGIIASILILIIFVTIVITTLFSQEITERILIFYENTKHTIAFLVTLLTILTLFYISENNRKKERLPEISAGFQIKHKHLLCLVIKNSGKTKAKNIKVDVLVFNAEKRCEEIKERIEGIKRDVFCLGSNQEVCVYLRDVRNIREDKTEHFFNLSLKLSYSSFDKKERMEFFTDNIYRYKGQEAYVKAIESNSSKL